MSLHAQQSLAALEKFRSQRRRATISSMVIALLVVILICLILGAFLLPSAFRETPTIVTYESNLDEETTLETKKVNLSTERKPSAPSSSMTKVIAANATSNIAIPVPDVQVTTPSLDFGDGDDFGTGWGDGTGSGGGGMFGSATGPGLPGIFYDLKQDMNGRPTDMTFRGIETSGGMDPNLPVNSVYDSHLRRAIGRNLDRNSFSKFFQAPRQLRLQQFYVPRVSAEEAPKAFKTDGTVKGRRWVVVYSGTVTPPESGRYRFAGFGDDVLMVLADKRMIFDGSLQSPLRGAEKRASYHQPHTVDIWNTYVGEWIEIRAGRPIDLKVLIGERPGGHFSGYLLIEKAGVNYQKDANGFSTVPLFKMVPSSMPERGETLPDVAPDTSWSIWPAKG